MPYMAFRSPSASDGCKLNATRVFPMPVRPQQSETPTASPAQMPPEVPLIQASGADFGAETGREDDFGLDPALDPALDDAASPDSPQPSRAPRVRKDMATS